MATMLYRPSAPFYVQFEVTDRCNHRCFFCYNETARSSGAPLSTLEAKKLLDQMRESGVFSVNFNGGEPLLRDDFFELARYAKKLGFDLHLNTNATCIDDRAAGMLAELFPSLCTSVLAATAERHDALVGVRGAYRRMRQGLERVLRHGMRAEINVCTFKGNYRELCDIARELAHPGVHVFCATRYILASGEGSGQVLEPSETIAVLDSLERIAAEFPTYREVKLPGPVPYCELPPEQWPRLRRWNTPCQAGFGLCRISPQGDMTPCPLSDMSMGNVRRESFAALWRSPRWNAFAAMEHLPPACRGCAELKSCRGGCVYYDQCLLAHGRKPQTRKWAGA